MGLPVSLILIAAGAILAWGVTDEPSGLNLDAIGVILIVIGIIGFILTHPDVAELVGPRLLQPGDVRRGRAGPVVVPGRVRAATNDLRRGRSAALGRPPRGSAVLLREPA